MEDYDQAESKFGRIYKVAGPCKLLAQREGSRFPSGPSGLLSAEV